MSDFGQEEQGHGMDQAGITSQQQLNRWGRELGYTMKSIETGQNKTRERHKKSTGTGDDQIELLGD